MESQETQGSQGSNPQALDPKILLATLQKVKKGDFSARLPEHFTGIDGKICEVFNQVVEINDQLFTELTD